MKESKIVRGVVATVAVIAFSLPAFASADDGDELKGRSEKVSYADLNIEKEAGVHTLYRRLQLASKRVCGVESLKVTGSIRNVSDSRRCYRNSLDKAVARFDNSKLTAIHEG
jgi:UrcA family protein